MQEGPVKKLRVDVGWDLWKSAEEAEETSVEFKLAGYNLAGEEVAGIDAGAGEGDGFRVEEYVPPVPGGGEGEEGGGEGEEGDDEAIPEDDDKAAEEGECCAGLRGAVHLVTPGTGNLLCWDAICAGERRMLRCGHIVSIWINHMKF